MVCTTVSVLLASYGYFLNFDLYSGAFLRQTSARIDSSCDLTDPGQVLRIAAHESTSATAATCQREDRGVPGVVVNVKLISAARLLEGGVFNQTVNIRPQLLVLCELIATVIAQDVGRTEDPLWEGRSINVPLDINGGSSQGPAMTSARLSFPPSFHSPYSPFVSRSARSKSLTSSAMVSLNSLRHPACLSAAYDVRYERWYRYVELTSSLRLNVAVEGRNQTSIGQICLQANDCSLI